MLHMGAQSDSLHRRNLLPKNQDSAPSGNSVFPAWQMQQKRVLKELFAKEKTIGTLIKSD